MSMDRRGLARCKNLVIKATAVRKRVVDAGMGMATAESSGATAAFRIVYELRQAVGVASLFPLAHQWCLR